MAVSLPVFFADVTGTEISTNLNQALEEVKALAAEEINKPLETDADFADKEQLNKGR